MKRLLLILAVVALVAVVILVVKVPCEQCEGAGVIPARVDRIECKPCGGTGIRHVLETPSRVDRLSERQIECVFCRGQGYKEKTLAEEKTCSVCGGTGRCTLADRIVRRREAHAQGVEGK